MEMEKAETRILTTLLLTAFPDEETVINEVQDMSIEIIRILINYYSTFCTNENKELTNFVVNSQLLGTVMENYLKGINTCLEELNQRRKIQMSVNLKWWQKIRLIILKYQTMSLCLILLSIIIVNILILALLINIILQ